MEDYVFDPDTVEDSNLLPEGSYDLEIVKASFEGNKKGTGKLLKLQTRVINGSQEVDGRSLFIQLNLVHDNPKAQQIGAGQFKKLLNAVGREGKFNLSTDLESLIGKQFTSFVKIEEGFNQVKNYKALDNLKF